MSRKYKISIEDGITLVVFELEPSYDDIVEMVDIIVKDFPYEKRLYDLTNVHFDLSVSELQALASYCKQIFTRPNKAAIFTTEDLAFGEGRQFMVYREEENHAYICVFRDKGEAVEWLNQ